MIKRVCLITPPSIFLLDERVNADLLREIEAVLFSPDQNGPVAYYLPRKNYYCGKWVKWAGCYFDY